MSAALAGILCFGLATLWVPAGWAACSLEAAVFLLTAWRLRRPIRGGGAIPILLAGMCLLGVVQLVLRWTVVPADTADAVVYWCAAACFAWLGTQVKPEPFLRAALVCGSAVCLLGVVQMFTSGGRVFWIFQSGYDSGVIGPFVSRNNYAALVELLLPVALALALRRGRHAWAWMVLAAALPASVIAAGSRAGTAIVLAEAGVVFLLLRRRGWIPFAVLSAAFTLVVGYGPLWERLRGDRDPLEFRREFVESSVAMARAEPVHGFGLGTWPSAYRGYALIDPGLPVQHAHNEWVQWAAEGGLPALALMLAVAVLAARSAARNVWALGIVAVLVHALVDYPFLRLGLACWIFAFLGVAWGARKLVFRRPGKMPVSARPLPDGRGSDPRRDRAPGCLAPKHAVTGLVRGIAMAILLVAACQAVRTAWADGLYRGGDVEAAARLRPDRAEYYVADPERALRHNPFLTTARMQLAARLEMQGASDAAEAALLVGAERDRQYAPAWALANFYYRAGRADRFWPWARAAAQVSPGGLAPLFDLSFAMQDDAAAVWQRVAMSRPMVEREYLSYLLERGHLEAARDAALRIGARAAAEDREPLLRYVDGALAGGQTESAAAVWNRLCARRLVPYAPRAAGELVNGDFRRPSLDRGFDWRAGTAGCAVAARSASDGPAMEWFLSPHRPERCELYAQALHVADGARYVLRFEYRTRDMRDPTGVRWTLGNGLESEIRAAEGWTGAAWHWQASEDTRRLALAWRRAPGSTRGEGGILLRRVRLEPDSEISQKE